MISEGLGRGVSDPESLSATEKFLMKKFNNTLSVLGIDITQQTGMQALDPYGSAIDESRSI